VILIIQVWQGEESNVFMFFNSILVHQFIMGANVQKHQDCINKGIFWDSMRPIVVSGGQEDMRSSRCFHGDQI